MKTCFLTLILWVSGISVVFSQSKKDITLAEIWASPAFRSQQIMGINPMKDGMHYTTLTTNDEQLLIQKFNYEQTEKESDILLSTDYTLPNGKTPEFGEYTFCEDESKLLVPTESEPIYRYSSRSAFVVIDLKAKTAAYLSAGKQQYAEFSPDGKKVAFVRDNNLFIKDLENGNETGITSDGKQNSIINGATDWVYEEEFALAQAFFWSPDSKRLAFLKFNESSVKEFNMPTYGTLYPGDYRFKYPKAGEDNSLVTVFVCNVATNNLVKMKSGDDSNLYFPRLNWTSKGEQLCITRLNRHQNHLELLLANPETGDIKLLMEEKSETYIDIHDNLRFLADGKRFIWSSELGGFNQLYLYGMDGKKIHAITSGNADVTDFYGFNEKSGEVFYQTASPTPSDRSIYSIKLTGKAARNLAPGSGHHRPEFSSDFRYFILNSSKANEPYRFELFAGSGKLIRVLESNDPLKEKLATYRLSPKEFFNFKNKGGVELNGWMIKPPDFDPAKKYPVFMTVYGGPGHNTVENSWGGSDYFWHQLLAEKGYIVVSVDNRGTGNRGEAFKKMTYKQLGKLETEDQLDAAQYLAGLSYVDGSRIGIQGWSYGGYMSSLCITKGADLFKMAIAVAPVTNWRYYDSIYTERFMQTPQENASGYDDNSPINHVSRLKGKYLLIHGTADDNVHFQNSVEMVSALVRANKQFDVFYYPDKNHGIYGGNTRLHLYTMMTDYIIKNL
jgi:dipeptidyl-peptidase-4